MKLTKADKIKLAIILLGSLSIAIWDSPTWLHTVKLPMMLLVPFTVLLRTLLAGLIIYGILRLFHTPKTERSFFAHILYYGFHFAVLRTLYLITKSLYFQ